MRFFVFMHVLTMFAAVAVAGGAELLLARIAATRDVAAIRTAFATYARIGLVVPALFLLGVAFGLIAVFTEGFDPFQPWLLLAYPIFIAGMALGAGVTGPWVARVADAAASAGGAPSAELEATISDRRARLAFVAFWMLVAAIIFVMVVKPLS